MAGVKTCPACGHHSDAKELYCDECGSSLASVGPEDNISRELQDLGSNEGPGGHAEPDRPASTDGPVIEFPWGAVAVRECLAVGRDERFSPLARHLEGVNDYVSRRHAELFLEEGILHVRHLGTTNPTYVNGRPLETGEVALLADGDRVEFSHHLPACVRIT